MTNDQKALPEPPTLAAVTMRSGNYEATISRGSIALVRIGPQGGRKEMFDVNLTQAAQVLDLVEAGRRTLASMEDA